MIKLRFIVAIIMIGIFSACTPTEAPKEETTTLEPPAEEAPPEVIAEYSEEVNTLAGHAAVISAFEAIEAMDEQTIKDLIYLTEIPAPPFQEEERAQAFRKLLEDAGADEAWIDEEGNVLAKVAGTEGSKTVALDAHIDTVFPIETDVRVRFKGDTLLAPGIGDDTRGLSMVVAVLKAIKAANIKTEANLVFVGTVGEEGPGDLRGVKYLFEKSPIKIDSWISIDGGSIGRVNNKGLGSKRYRVMFKGRGGHSWGAFGIGNPHHALGKAIDYFSKAAADYTKDGPKTSFNVGIINGGTSINSIPFESWMDVDMRSVSVDRLLEIERIFKESMQKALQDYNASGITDSVTLELTKIGDRPSGELSEELPLIQRAMAATVFFGEKPRLSRGSTNSNTPIALGIPAITIGRGGEGSGGHSLHEWWVNDNGTDAIKLALLTLVAEAGLDNESIIAR